MVLTREVTVGDVQSRAIFNPAKTHRFRLRRSFLVQPDMFGGKDMVRKRFEVKLRRLLYIMLNPSTADELKNDPTVERCQRRALLKGYNEFEVVNLFSLRATDPRELYKQDENDPVFIDNIIHVIDAVKEADTVVLGWGNHGKLFGMDERVLNAIYYMDQTRPLYCLGVSKSGQPKHPLYISYKKDWEVFQRVEVVS